MKNLRNKNQPVNADLVQVYLQSSWDIVTAVYAELDNIETVAGQINGGGLNFLTPADIDTLAELNAILTDAQLGRFSTQGEAEAGTDNTTTMTPLRVAQAIAALSENLLNNWTGSGPPTVTDDSNLGYSAGSVWIDVIATPNESYRCADPAVGAAVWLKTTLTADELATVAVSGNSDDLTEGVTKLLMSVAERNKLGAIEPSATADQTDSEIKTAYENLTTLVSQAEAEAGVSTTVRLWTAERVAQAIAALGGGGGLVWSSYSTSQSVAAGTGSVFYGLAATVTATLPATPAVGDTLMIMNNDNNALDSYNVNIAAGGSNEIIEQNINYIPQAVVQQGETAILVCRENGATKRWHMQRWTSALDLGGTGGGMTVTSIKTGNYTASANEVVPVDSTSGSFTITMPASMSAGERVIIADVGKYCGVNPVTIGRNSQTFDGVAADFILDQSNGRVDGMADGLGDIATHLIGTPEVININDFATGFGGVNAQTGTTYTFADSDLALLVTASNAAASAYDIPDSLGAVGETLNLLNIGVGTVTIAVPGTDTLGSTANSVATGKAATVVKTAATTWWVVGGA